MYSQVSLCRCLGSVCVLVETSFHLALPTLRPRSSLSSDLSPPPIPCRLAEMRVSDVIKGGIGPMKLALQHLRLIGRDSSCLAHIALGIR